MKRSKKTLTCSHSSSNKDGVVSKSNIGGLVLKPQTGRTYYSAGVHMYEENSFNVNAHTAEEKIGVLLLNLGGPDRLQDVEPFLFNLFADPVHYNFRLSFTFEK